MSPEAALLCCQFAGKHARPDLGKTLAFLMPTSFLIPVLMRVAGPLAFVVSAMTAGVMNRSPLLIPLLAVVATVTTLVIRKVTPSPASDLQSVLTPGADPAPPNIFRGTGKRFAIGLVGYAIAFWIAAMIAAVFQTTEFEPRVMWSDVGFMLVPTILAVIGAWISARIGMSQMASMMGQMQDIFQQMQADQGMTPADEDAFTVDGEVIDPDDETPAS